MNWATRKANIRQQANETEVLEHPQQTAFRKLGYVELYMNGDLIRTKRYNSPSDRTKIVQGWLLEAKKIMDVNTFYYVIKPEL